MSMIKKLTCHVALFVSLFKISIWFFLFLLCWIKVLVGRSN